MTQEEKAKAYDEAIERAKKHCADYVVETIFPELAESEDERIRKAMIDFFKREREEGITVLHYGVNIESMIAWLEKQYADPIKEYWRGYREGKKEILDKYSELEKQGEQNPTWSEEDKNYYDTIVRKLEVIGDDSGLSNNQIRFLREHCPLHSSEWSKEDEQIILSIEQIMNCASLLNIVPEKIDKIKSWLKSLKNRYAWKPSDEQMLAINTAINVLGKGTLNGKQLIELREELQKLKEG